MFDYNFNRSFGMGIFYHECPICNRIIDDGDPISGLCMYCCDRYDELSARTDLSDDDKAFIKRYEDIDNAAYKRVNMDIDTE